MPFREAGLPILMHSDGQIQQILPDLVEIGLTVLKPGAAGGPRSHLAAGELRGKLAFYGGISTQTVLPNGTPDEKCTGPWLPVLVAAGRYRSAACAVAPHDDRHPAGQRRRWWMRSAGWRRIDRR